jgi:hypothetical protein
MNLIANLGADLDGTCSIGVDGRAVRAVADILASRGIGQGGAGREREDEYEGF